MTLHVTCIYESWAGCLLWLAGVMLGHLCCLYANSARQFWVLLVPEVSKVGAGQPYLTIQASHLVPTPLEPAFVYLCVRCLHMFEGLYCVASDTKSMTAAPGCSCSCAAH